MSTIDSGPAVIVPAIEEKTMDVTLTFKTDQQKIEAFQAARATRSTPIVIPCDPYEETIADPAFVPDPKDPDVVAKQVPNPESLTDFVRRTTFKAMVDQVILGGINAVGDKIIQDAMSAANDAAQVQQKAYVDAQKPLLDLPIDISVA